MRRIGAALTPRSWFEDSDVPFLQEASLETQQKSYSRKSQSM